MKNAERVTGTKKMFREKRFLQKKRLLAVLLLTVLSICLVGGLSSDAKILSKVVLPEPDSPIIATYSPFSTEKLTLERA